MATTKSPKRSGKSTAATPKKTPTKKVTTPKKTPVKHKKIDERLKEAEKEELNNDEIDVPSDSSSDESDDEELKGLDVDESDREEQEEEAKKTQNKKESVTSKQSVHSITTPKSSTTKSSKSSTNKEKKRGVIYVGRIPHGFYEDELRKYFSQFGEITRLRLSRNKKTGKSKHYAFIEFQSLEVAKVAAETMNNYLIFNHQLKVSVLPIEKIHDELFTGSNIKFKPVPWSKISQVRNDKPKSLEKWGKIQKKSKTNLKNKQSKLKEQGINFDISKL